jgi:hypothetical protein
MDLEVHVMAKETSPKWRQDDPSVTVSTYQDMTDQVWLDQKSHLTRKIHTAEARRRLEGTATMSRVNVPGSTVTMRWLSTEFYDPHKTRFKSIYMKDYCNPGFEATLSSRATPTIPDTPTRSALVGTWTPGWKSANK